jgi:hypothetical protein
MEYIGLTETNLQLSNQKQPKETAMDVNHAINDFIDNLESLELSLPWSKVPYHKVLL